MQSLFNNQDEEILLPAVFDHPGVELEKKEKARELFNVLKNIPDKQRIAFTLHKLEGKSHQEVAEIMNTTLFAVESLISRAKANLKKELIKYYGTLKDTI